MAKKVEKQSFYDKILTKRVPIMLTMLFVILPLFFVVGFYTASYNANKPNPFAEAYGEDTVIEYVDLDYLNENKFVIESFYISKFYLQERSTDQGKGEYLESGSIQFKIDMGAKVDSNISSASAYVTTHACWNWANITSPKGIRTANFSSNETSYTISNIDATFGKMPFLFVFVSIEDVIFHTSFKVTEKRNDVETEVVYVVKHKYKDLITSETLFY